MMAQTYYAVIHPRFTLEWPSGLVRRTVDESGTTFDEDWTARKRWEPSTFFLGPRFGDFTDDGVPYAEIDPAEAERVREMLGIWPRGGPFQPAGQAWLAAHPEDPAAKYLGVAAPEFDSAGRLVKPGDAGRTMAEDDRHPSETPGRGGVESVRKTLALLTAERVIADLRRHFGEAAGGFSVRDLEDAGTRFAFTIEFDLYDYLPVVFNLDDRGFFGFALADGGRGAAVLGSLETGPLHDFPSIAAELDRRIRLRIPEEYLEQYVRKEAP